MNFRIGGEFEISTGFLSAPQGSAAPDLQKSHLLWLDTGRAALYIALQDIVARGGLRQAWVPAYVCPSVLAVFAALNFEVNHYSVGVDFMTPELPAELSSRQTFLYVHYFGQENAPIMNWLARYPHREEIFVIEDCVQASLNANAGASGDYAITSYRKFLPQPDGALLGSDRPIEAQLLEPNEAFVSARFLGKLLRHQNAPETSYLPLFDEAEHMLDQHFPPRRISWLSSYLMSRTDVADVSERRRRNWRYLSMQIKNSGLQAQALSPIFETIDGGVTPLGFPIKVHGGRRDALRRHLASCQIFCPVHWTLSHLENNRRWTQEVALSRSLLTLPIDQRLDEVALDRLVREIQIFFDTES